MDWKVFWITFGTVFLAEMGDKTQLAALTMTAETGVPMSVFTGACAALCPHTRNLTAELQQIEASGVQMNFTGCPYPEEWKKRYGRTTDHGTAFEGTEGWVHVDRGGIQLARDPEAITLRQVIEAVEGPIYLNRCLSHPGECSLERACPAHPVWGHIQDVLTRELEAVTVSQMITVRPRLARVAKRRTH